MRPVGTGGGGGAAVNTKPLEDLPEVVLHREEAAIEDDRDLGIRLPLGDPVQHLRLTRGQVEMEMQELCGGGRLRSNGGFGQAPF